MCVDLLVEALDQRRRPAGSRCSTAGARRSPRGGRARGRRCTIAPRFSAAPALHPRVFSRPLGDVVDPALDDEDDGVLLHAVVEPLRAISSVRLARRSRSCGSAAWGRPSAPSTATGSSRRHRSRASRAEADPGRIDPGEPATIESPSVATTISGPAESPARSTSACGGSPAGSRLGSSPQPRGDRAPGPRRGRAASASQVYMPPNWPPVTFTTWPWT